MCRRGWELMLTLQLLCRRSQMLQASPRRSLTQQAILGAALLPCRLATSQTLEATSSLHQWTTCWATACLRPCAALPPRLASGMARWVLGLSLEIVLQPDIKALPSCAELAAEQQLKYIRISSWPLASAVHGMCCTASSQGFCSCSRVRLLVTHGRS